MARRSCPNCGTTIDLAEEVGTGETVPLEIYTDASGDAPRYRVVGMRARAIIERVPTGAAGDYYPDHRHDCPSWNAGR